MPLFRFRSGIKSGRNIMGVIAELVRISDQQGFGWSEKAGKSHFQACECTVISHVPQHRLFHIHRKNKTDRLFLSQGGVAWIVNEMLKQHPFHQGAHFAGHIAEVNRGAKKQGVSRLNLLQNRGQAVLIAALAVAASAFSFAGKAADTAFIVQVVEMNEFGLGSL